MLISDRHRQQYRDHYKTREPRDRENVWALTAAKIAMQVNATSLLDYGSGISNGFANGFLNCARYDPAVPGIDGPPLPADLVVCVHTLEHVESDCLAEVLAHIDSLAIKATLLVVSTEESTKVLPDGSPWHCLVRPPAWWLDVLKDYVPINPIKPRHLEFACVKVKQS